MVTANDQRHQLALLVFGEQCFDRLLGGNTQLLGERINRGHAGRREFLQRGHFTVFGGATSRWQGGRQLHVGRVVAAGRKGNGVFATFCQNMELVGVCPTNSAGIGLDRPEVEAEPGKDRGVGFVHAPIGLFL